MRIGVEVTSAAEGVCKKRNQANPTKEAYANRAAFALRLVVGPGNTSSSGALVLRLRLGVVSATGRLADRALVGFSFDREVAMASSTTEGGISNGSDEGGSIDIALPFLPSNEEEDENADGGSFLFTPDEGDASTIDTSSSSIGVAGPPVVTSADWSPSSVVAPSSPFRSGVVWLKPVMDRAGVPPRRRLSAFVRQRRRGRTKRKTHRVVASKASSRRKSLKKWER